MTALAQWWTAVKWSSLARNNVFRGTANKFKVPVSMFSHQSFPNAFKSHLGFTFNFSHLSFGIKKPRGGKKQDPHISCRNCVSWRLSGAALLARMCTNNKPVYFAIYWEWEKMKLKHKNLRMHSICSTFKNKIRKNINAWRWQVRARSHYLNIWLEFHQCFARQCVYLVSVCVGRSV